MNRDFEFERLQDGAWSAWSGRVHLGTLLRAGGSWEAFTEDGRMVVNDDRRPRYFRSRVEAASALDLLRQE